MAENGNVQNEIKNVGVENFKRIVNSSMTFVWSCQMQKMPVVFKRSLTRILRPTSLPMASIVKVLPLPCPHTLSSPLSCPNNLFYNRSLISLLTTTRTRTHTHTHAPANTPTPINRSYPETTRPTTHDQLNYSTLIALSPAIFAPFCTKVKNPQN